MWVRRVSGRVALHYRRNQPIVAQRTKIGQRPWSSVIAHTVVTPRTPIATSLQFNASSLQTAASALCPRARQHTRTRGEYCVAGNRCFWHCASPAFKPASHLYAQVLVGKQPTGFAWFASCVCQGQQQHQQHQDLHNVRKITIFLQPNIQKCKP